MMPGQVGWIKRRARRIEKAFHVARKAALQCAFEDWQGLHGRAARQAAAPRSCDQLGLCQSYNPSCAGCAPTRTVLTTGLLPQPFAPGVIEGPPLGRWSWRAVWRWLSGPTP